MRTKDKERIRGTVFIISVIFILTACAAEKKAQKDPFFDKWSTMAETATGHSPAPKTRVIDIPQAINSGEAEAGKAAEKSLPTYTVNLKMRQADVKAVLRALARAAGLNLLIKNEVKGEISVDFRDVPWNQAFGGILHTQGLTYVWEGDIIRVLTADDMEQDLKFSGVIDKRKAQEQSGRLTEPLSTVFVPIDYADAAKLTQNIADFLTKDKDGKPRGSVKVDEHSNALVINAVRDDINRMIPIIEKIDKPTPQIMIKANIVETTKETARALGIQWGGMYARKVGDQSLFITPGGLAGSATAPGSALSGQYKPSFGSAGISGQGFGVNFPVPSSIMQTATGLGSLGLMIGSIGGNILDLQLTALQKDGKLNILSSPSITTLDNQKAYTENGESVPYVSIDTTTTPATQTVNFKDAVLRLEITPHVIDGKNLKMKILVKKDEVDTTRTVQGNPFIIKKQTETSLIVQDGETIVISGLSKQTKSDNNAGLPGLKDVPVLGWLFKEDDKSQKMEEVLIFITPKILEQAVASVPPRSPMTTSPQPTPETAPSSSGSEKKTE